MSKYASIVTDMLEIPKEADTRDTTAIIRLATAYLKLLFPNVNSVMDVDRDEFETFCFKPAYEKKNS